jgi:hypothetical protein
MPFGLKNGPSILQRVMQGILVPYLWLFCLVYIDDIVGYSKSYEEHIDHLDKVLGAIEKAGLTLSPNKCHLFYSFILLLGHKVSRLELSTHLEKVKGDFRTGAASEIITALNLSGNGCVFLDFHPILRGYLCTAISATEERSKVELGSRPRTCFPRVQGRFA